MKKRLVYFIYLPDYINNMFQCETFTLHLLMLEKYSKLFDKAIFCISEDERNEVHERTIQCLLLDFFKGKDVEFIFEKNDKNLREVNFFYDTIVKKIGEFDGITFWGHNKGYTNGAWGDNIFLWNTAMYYFNLEVFDDVLRFLKGGGLGVSYGTFIEHSEKVLNKYNWMYGGTFFWLEDKRLRDIIKLYNAKIDKPSTRFYAEVLFGNIFPFDFNYVGSYGKFYYGAVSIYEHAKDMIDSTYPYDIKNKFYEFYNYYREECKKCKYVKMIYGGEVSDEEI